MMKLDLKLKNHFYADENLFAVFYTNNEFAKYFVSQITVIPWNDTFLHYRKNQIS